MSNRVIKDSIWSSPTLAKLSIDAQLHWPRLLLMADDWGCFNADLDVVLGLIYPKMKMMTLKKVNALLDIYQQAGMLFIWQEGERSWGYFTSWNGHQYCNATNLDEDGKNQKHRRKTPEPPEKELQDYLNTYLYKKQGVSGKLEHFRTGRNIFLNPIPIPIPIPIPNPNPAFAEFEKFWKAYPKKKSKGHAEKAWLKINPSEQLLETILSTIKRATTSEDWQKENGKYIPHPATWLNAKGWEDEYTPAAPAPSQMSRTLSALERAREIVEGKEGKKALGGGE